MLWLVDTQFSYAGTQRAAVEPKDFGSPVFAAHFPIGLLKYPDNMAALNLFQGFLRGRYILMRLFQLIYQAQFGT